LVWLDSVEVAGVVPVGVAVPDCSDGVGAGCVDGVEDGCVVGGVTDCVGGVVDGAGWAGDGGAACPGCEVEGGTGCLPA